MTPAQTATLKAYILANLSQYASGVGTDYQAIANALNEPTTFVVWQSNLTPELARQGILGGVTQLDNLTVGKRDALLYLVSSTLDCRISSVRSAFDDLTGTQNTLKAALLVVQKRFAKLAEKLLAVGTGSDAAPAMTSFEGDVLLQDIGAILG